MKKGLYILLFCILTSSFLSGLDRNKYITQYLQTTWTSEEGLPANNVLDVIQDSLGYIWIGTYEGLVRFDGYKFVLFNKRTLETFKSNSARVIMEDSDGVIWVGSNSEGVARFSAGDVTMYTVEEGLPDNSIRALCEDADKAVWIGTTKGVIFIKDGTFNHISEQEELRNSSINFIYNDVNGRLWVGTDQGHIFYKDKNSENGFAQYLDIPELAGNNVKSMLMDKKGGLWFATVEGNIFYHDSSLKIFKENDLRMSTINKIYEDSQGVLWFGTDKGLLRYDEGKIDTFSEENGLPDNLIESLCEDREGNLWLATSRGGLVKLTDSKFTTFNTDEGLINNKINVILEDRRGRKWIGTDSGVNLLDNGKIISSIPGKHLQNVRIRHIYQDSKETIWFSTYSNMGLLAFKEGGKPRSYTVKQGLAGDRVRVVCEGQNGDIWVGTKTGLSRIRDSKITTYTRSDGLTNDYILSIFEDSHGVLWIGTDGGGLNYFKNGKFGAYTTDNGLVNNIVFRVYEDSNKVLWISTAGGISRFHQDKFFNFTVESGLMSSAIFQIIEDDIGFFWMTSSNAVSYIHKDEFNQIVTGKKEKLAPEFFDKYSGLKGGVTAVSWGIKDKEGKLWFPTLEGVAMIDPLNIMVNNTKPVAIIEKVIVNDEPYFPGVIKKLEPGTKRIIFDYTGLSYVTPEKVSFQYKLEGFDREWSLFTNRREATYTNLSPGKYIFHVKAANNDGIWSKQEASVSFYQAPFFYQTTWFIIIVVLLVVILATSFYFIRINTLKRQKLALEEIVRERTQDYKDEKEKADKLLLNILPASVAGDLKNKGTSDPRTFDNVTVFFSDMINFTKLSSALDPKILISELNDVFTAFDNICEKNGCERIKTIGDAYLAVCGMPLENQNHAENIVKSAIQIIEYLNKRNNNRTSKVKWEVRIGINTGKVVGGVVGIKKYIYDVFGDTVNTASRLEHVSEPMRINISEATYQLVKDKFTCIPLEDSWIKGKGVMKIYYIDREVE